jgi:hypothetical protein
MRLGRRQWRGNGTFTFGHGIGCDGGLGSDSRNGRRRLVVGFIVIVVGRGVIVLALVLVVIMRAVMIVMLVMIMVVMIVVVRFAVMLGIGVQMLALMRGGLSVLGRRVAFLGLGSGMGTGVQTLDDVALDPLAMAAAAGIAVARATAAVGAVLVLLLGLAMGLLVGLDQGLPVGDRDLVVVGMDFAEGEEAVAVAAIFDEGGLERRFDPRDLGEVDVPAQLLALRGFEIKLFDAVAADHDDPGLFRVGGIDQHLVGHVLTLGGGGRDSPWALLALPGDATVHLIRG